MRGRADDCWDAMLVFYIETAAVDAHLPEGYAAESASRTYARIIGSNAAVLNSDTVFPPAVPEDYSAVSLVTHNCASATPGMGTMEESWVWAFIAPPAPAAELGLGRATLDIYEFAHAGGSPETFTRKESLGWTMFGDRVDAPPLEVAVTTGALTNGGHVFDGSVESMMIQVSSARETPLKGQGVLRIWHDAPSGFSFADFDTGTSGVTNFVASEFDCRFAPGTPAAIITGYATCADALGDVSRPAPTAIINPSHAHPITFRYFAK